MGEGGKHFEIMSTIDHCTKSRLVNICYLSDLHLFSNMLARILNKGCLVNLGCSSSSLEELYVSQIRKDACLRARASDPAMPHVTLCHEECAKAHM